MRKFGYKAEHVFRSIHRFAQHPGMHFAFALTKRICGDATQIQGFGRVFRIHRSIRGIDFGEELTIDELTKDMTEQGMSFLDARCFAAWNAKQNFDAVLQFSAGLSGKADSEQAL